MDGRVEGNTRLAVNQLAAEQQDLADLGCDLEIRGRLAAAMAELITVRQSGMPVDVTDGRWNVQEDAIFNSSESDSKTRCDDNFAPWRYMPHREQMHAFEQLLVEDGALSSIDGVLVDLARGRLGASHSFEQAICDASFEAVEDGVHRQGKRHRRFDALLFIVAIGPDHRHLGEAATDIDVISSGDERYRPCAGHEGGAGNRLANRIASAL